MGRSTLDHRLISTQKLSIQKIFKMKIVPSLAFGLFTVGAASPMIPLPFESKNFQSAIQSDDICKKPANPSNGEIAWKQCYWDNNGYYGIVNQKYNWDDAKSACQAAKGNLLSFTDSATSQTQDGDRDYCAFTMIVDEGYNGELILYSGRVETKNKKDWFWCPDATGNGAVGPSKCLPTPAGSSTGLPSPVPEAGDNRYSNWKVRSEDSLREGEYMGGYISVNGNGNDFDSYGWVLGQTNEVNNDKVHAMCYFPCR